MGSQRKGLKMTKKNPFAAWAMARNGSLIREVNRVCACVKGKPLPTHSVDVESERGSMGQSTHPQVDELVRAGHYNEVSHAQYSSNLHKIFQHITLSHLDQGKNINFTKARNLNHFCIRVRSLQ